MLIKTLREGGQSVARVFDFVMFLCLFLLLFFLYFFVEEERKVDIAKTGINASFSFLNHPLSAIPIAFLLLFYYIVVFLFNIKTKSVFMNGFELFLWVLFALLFIVAFFKIFLYIDIFMAANEWFMESMFMESMFMESMLS